MGKKIAVALLALVLALSGCIGSGSPPGAGQPAFDLAYIYLPLMAAFFLLALAFMLSKLFNMPHWVPIIGDELLQAIATGAVAILLVGVQCGVDGCLADAYLATGEALPPSCAASKIGCANDIAYAKLSSLKLEEIFLGLRGSAQAIGQEASKGIYCSMLNVGFTLSNCGQLNAYRGSLTLASFTVMAGIWDVYAQQFLLSLAKSYSFSLIIPLGLFFRCFKASRPAGGALVAIGFGFYTAYPLVIIAMGSLLTGFAPGTAIMDEPAQAAVPVLSGNTMGCDGGGDCGNQDDEASCRATAGCTWTGLCDAYEMSAQVSKAQFSDFGARLTDQSVTQGLAYAVLVKGIFMSILNLVVTLGFIRIFAHFLGSEIDVSSLARIS